MTASTTTLQTALTAYETASAAGSFPTKAAQKNTRELVSRAFDSIRQDLMDRLLETRDADNKMPSAENDLYWSVPSYPHQYKAKHDAAIRALGHHDLASLLGELSKMTAQIKDIPVAPKAPTKAEAERVVVVRRIAQNPEIETVVREQVKPQVFNEHFDGMFNRAKRVLEIVSMPESQQTEQFSPEALRRIRSEARWMINAGFINVQALRDRAMRIADAETGALLHKTMLKIGAADLTECSYWNGDFVVRGTQKGREVEMVQQTVFKVNQNDTAFYQWPARIYVDGAFTPEAEFAALMD